jgi:hypothetical protein
MPERYALSAVLSCAILLAFAFALAPGASAARKPPAPQLSALGTTPLKVSGEQGQDTAIAYFSLLNEGSTPVQISVTFQAASSEKVTAAPLQPTEISAKTAQRIGVTFAGINGLEDKVEGQLIVEGGAAPVAVGVEVDPAPHPSASWPLLVILLSLGIVVLTTFGLVLAAASHGSLRLGSPAPAPKWSFESWATTLTGAAVLIGTVLSEATFPEFPTQITKSTLVDLNLLFAGLLVLGPFVFQALRRPQANAAAQEAGLWGWNATLLFACALTFWAVLGELGALALLTWELTSGGAAGVILLVTLALVAVLAITYFCVTVSQMITRDWRDTVDQSVAVGGGSPVAPAATIVAPAPGEPPPEPVPPARPRVHHDWRLL